MENVCRTDVLAFTNRRRCMEMERRRRVRGVSGVAGVGGSTAKETVGTREMARRSGDFSSSSTTTVSLHSLTRRGRHVCGEALLPGSGGNNLAGSDFDLLRL